MTPSAARECINQQISSIFQKIHDAILDAHNVITPSNGRDKMTDFTRQLGVNVETFQAYMPIQELNIKWSKNWRRTMR